MKKYGCPECGCDTAMETRRVFFDSFKSDISNKVIFTIRQERHYPTKYTCVNCGHEFDEPEEVEVEE